MRVRIVISHASMRSPTRVPYTNKPLHARQVEIAVYLAYLAYALLDRYPSIGNCCQPDAIVASVFHPAETLDKLWGYLRMVIGDYSYYRTHDQIFSGHSVFIT